MKTFRLFNFISCFVSLMFLPGCTLVMDEEITDEKAHEEDVELMGFDEPYTLETEYGDITYQFGDSTRVLRKAALDYLISNVGDTIFYFSDNIPGELLIQPGNYIYLGCCDEIPFGLCNRVLSLTHETGMYKMATTPVRPERVFAQLEYTLDYDYKSLSSALEDIDSTIYQAHGFKSGDVVLLDRSVLQKKAKRSVTPSSMLFTRGMRGDINGETVGEPEWGDGEGFEESDWKEETITVLEISTADRTGKTSSDKLLEKIIGTAFNNITKFLNDHHLSLDLGVYKNIRQKVRQKVVMNSNEDLTVREQWTRDESKLLLDLKLKASVGSSNVKPETMYQEWNTVLKAARAFGKDESFMSNKLAIVIAIPVGGPVVLFVRIQPYYSVEVGLYGEAQVEIKFATTVSYAKSIGDKDVTPKDMREPQEIGTTKVNPVKLSGGGFFTLKGGAEVCLGAGSGVGDHMVGIGIGVDAGTNITLNLDADEGRLSDDSYLTADIIAQIFVRTFYGIGNSRFNLHKFTYNLGKMEAWPKIGKSSSATLKETTNTVDLGFTKMSVLSGDFAASYKVVDMGLVGLADRLCVQSGILKTSDFQPAMRIYYTQNGENKAEEMDLKKSYWKGYLRNGDTYYFTKHIDKLNGYSNLRIYPGYFYNGVFRMFSENKTTPTIEGQPRMTLNKLCLIGKERKDVPDWSGGSTPTFTYTFAMNVRMENASYLKKLWYLWGTRVIIYGSDGKTKYINNQYTLTEINKNGLYNVKLKFTTTDPGKLSIITDLYYTLKSDDTDTPQYIEPDDIKTGQMSFDMSTEVSKMPSGKTVNLQLGY